MQLNAKKYNNSNATQAHKVFTAQYNVGFIDCNIHCNNYKAAN